jgi:beta-glucosidase
VSTGIEDRVDILLERMTLREKLAQLGGAWITDLVDGEAFAPTRAVQKIADGIGTVTRIGATTGLRPAARARLANDVQRYLVEQTSTGIPAIIHEESTAGFCARDATQFPQAIGLASMWDPDAV